MYANIDMNAIAFTIGDHDYTYQEVYDVASHKHLDIKSIIDGSFYVDYDAGFIIHEFGHAIKNSEEPLILADQVAKAFKDVYGAIMISPYYYHHRYMKLVTIMDWLEEGDEIDEVANWIMFRAFKKAGFKYAKECSRKELYAQVARCGLPPYMFEAKLPVPYTGRYDRYASGISYAYNTIKNHRSVINQEVMKYLYRPDRIAKWIESGNDLEDYLP